MPIIQVKLIDGAFTRKQKQQMLSELTDATVSIKGEQLSKVTIVAIEDVRSSDWGIDGQPITTQIVKAMAEEKT